MAGEFDYKNNPIKAGALENTIEDIVDKVVARQIAPIKLALEKMIVDREYSVKEAADILDVTPITIRNWMKKNEIGFKMVGKSYRITQHHLEDFIDYKSRRKTKSRK